MLIKYFNSNRADLLLLFPVIALVIWLSTLINHPLPVDINPGNTGPLGRLIMPYIVRIPYLVSILALLILFFYGYLLVQLNVKYFFLKTRLQLPQLFYIAIAGGLFYLRFFSASMLAAFFVIILIYRLFESFKKEKVAINFFDAGIFASLAVMIYLPCLVIFPIIYIALVSLRSFFWQEWIYPILGFCLPFFFWGSYLFLTDQSLNLIAYEFIKPFSGSIPKHDFSLVQVVYYGYLAILLIIASIHMILTINNRKIQSRIFLMLFFWFFVLSLTMFCLIRSTGVESIYFMGISLAFLFSNYFATCKNSRFNNILLGLLFIGLTAVIIDDWMGLGPNTFTF